MPVLVPRLLGDLSGWFDTEFPLRTGHLIRVEETATDTDYILRAELPGLDPEKDIQVTVAEGYLTVRAERRETDAVRGHSEFRYGATQRTLRLPAGADAEHITAKYVTGVLEVTVPLGAPAPAGKQIPIET